MLILIKWLTKSVSLLFVRWSPVVWSVPGQPRKVALTFDDGPTEWTTAVLEILSVAKVRATFFVLGQQVVKKPDMVSRMIKEGHEVAIHGYDHTLSQFAEQVHLCANELLRIYGASPHITRPPYGKIHPLSTLRLWLRGYRTILFNFDTHDSMRYEGKRDEAPVFSRVVGGDIILMHDDNPVCIDDLPILLQVMREKNLQPVTVSALLRRITNNK